MDRWPLAILIAIIAVAIVIVALTLLPAAIIKRRLIGELKRKSRGRLAITFDDGPGPLLTVPLLELLAEHGAKATFFLVGFRAERFPPSADAMAAAGHELGNHTHWHRHAWRQSPWAAVRDVNQGYRSMSRWMPSRGLFRPPFGKLTTWTFLTAKKRHAPLCFWTHDGGDTWRDLPDPKAIAREITSDGGAVVLLHSHDRGQDRQQYVLAITECLLRGAREHGLKVCTMSEILNQPAGV